MIGCRKSPVAIIWKWIGEPGYRSVAERMLSCPPFTVLHDKVRSRSLVYWRDGGLPEAGRRVTGLGSEVRSGLLCQAAVCRGTTYAQIKIGPTRLGWSQWLRRAVTNRIRPPHGDRLMVTATNSYFRHDENSTIIGVPWINLPLRRRRAAGSWQLAVESWQLAPIGRWELAAGRPPAAGKQ